MEIWDLYDKDGNPTGKTMVRGEQGIKGYYHLVVDALFLNSKGETLLPGWPPGVFFLYF